MRDAAPSLSSAAHPTRAFGRFELRRLLGRSVGSMAWLAFDPTLGAEVMLTMPRVQPVDGAALDRWHDEVRTAARLVHPNLAPAGEIGMQDHWPYVATGRAHGVTLAEWLGGMVRIDPGEAARWIGEALQGLAYAHDAGVAHHDLQLHGLLVSERGEVSVMALGAAGAATADERRADPRGTFRATTSPMPLDAARLRTQRDAATADVLACGLLLHRLLAGTPPLDEADTALAAARMAPTGRDSVRLPWTTPVPVPEALRAIVNRSTHGQPRLRYQGARTFLGALAGWREAHLDGGGPVATLIGRLKTVGHLPALPGIGTRVAELTRQERQKTHQIADRVLEDLALSFELLRTLQTAPVQGTQVQGNGPVLTLRRIIALIGIDGVRFAANRLRAWPGPLSEPHAAQLKLALARVRLAGFTAQALQPAGYDGQVVYMITVLQNLGRLMLRYHFADQAGQIQQLMRPVPADPVAGTPEQPGLGEAAAAFAVLGVDVETLGAAVARHWRLDEEVLHMIRRLPPDAPVRRPDSDADVLRVTANAANEAVDAISAVPPAQAGAVLARVGQRYARALGIDGHAVAEALQSAREAMRRGRTSLAGVATSGVAS